jgi:hypothetical protein
VFKGFLAVDKIFKGSYLFDRVYGKGLFITQLGIRYFAVALATGNKTGNGLHSSISSIAAINVCE